MKSLVALCMAVLVLLPAAAAAQFGDWSAPVKVDGVNSVYLDSCVTISKNGLSLIFSSNRQNPGTTNRDLYVSQRASVDEPWGAPEPLAMLNTTDWESCPLLSLDEHRLYFTSPRAGGCGGQDIWVSRRHDRRDAFGWEAPVNLGCDVAGGPNSSAGDQTPAIFEDEAGRVILYFSTYRTGNWDHYQSVMNEDDSFGEATPILELNGQRIDQGITVRRDGLEVVFLSNRENPSSLDFWAAIRESTTDPWSAPVPVPSLGSPAYSNGKISLSFDGRELYFTSYRDSNFDLWVARREKLK